MKLSERLLLLRKERHLTQEAAAEEIGLAYRSYRRYESGEREPDASTLWKIADHYTVTVDYLLGRSDRRDWWQSGHADQGNTNNLTVGV